MTVASSVVLPTPLRPMMLTFSPRREREIDVLEHDGLAVAGRDAAELERAQPWCACPR